MKQLDRNRTNKLIWFIYKLGRKFRNFVFSKRLGKKKWSAKIIFFIMGVFGFIESKVYINTKQVGNFDHYVPRLPLNRWRISENGTDKGQIQCWAKEGQKILIITTITENIVVME